MYWYPKSSGERSRNMFAFPRTVVDIGIGIGIGSGSSIGISIDINLGQCRSCGSRISSVIGQIAVARGMEREMQHQILGQVILLLLLVIY